MDASCARVGIGEEIEKMSDEDSQHIEGQRALEIAAMQSN